MEGGFYISIASPSGALYDNTYLAEEFEEKDTANLENISELKLYNINENDIREYDSLLWFIVPSNEFDNITTTVYRETLEDGEEYYIENVNSKKLLSSKGNSYIEQNEDFRMPNQRWRAHKKAGGYWSFSMDLQKNMYLSVDSASKKDEARICMQKLGSCDENAFLWHIDYTADGNLIFSSKCSDGDLIMAVATSWGDEEALNNGADIYQTTSDKISNARGKWIIRKVEDVPAPIESGKEYKLQNIHSEKFLSHRGVGKSSIDQTIDYHMPNQHWLAKDLGDGYWSFESVAQKGYYMSVGENFTYNEARIYAIQANGGNLTPQMRWKFIPTVNNNWALTPESGFGMYVLTIPVSAWSGNGKKEYQSVEQHTFVDEKLMNDEWRFIEVQKLPPAPIKSGKEYKLQNIHSEKFLSHRGVGKSSIDQTIDYHMPNQHWLAKDLGDGYWCFESVAQKGYYMSVGENFTYNEARIYAIQANGVNLTPKMRWKFIPTANNNWALTPESGFGMYVLTIPVSAWSGNGKKEYQSVEQHTFVDEKLMNDEWRFIEVQKLPPAPIKSGKEYKLQNVHSEKFLSHSGVGESHIDQSIDYRMPNQHWLAKDLGDGYWSFESVAQKGYYMSVGESFTYNEARVYAIKAKDGKLTPQMRWKFIPTINNNWAITPESGFGMYVLAIPISSWNENGKKEYENTWQQRFVNPKLMNDEWRFIEVQNKYISLVDGGYYRISNAESDMFVSSFSDDSDIKQYADKGKISDEKLKKRISQIWKIHKGSGIYADCYSFSPKGRPEYVLTVLDAYTYPGTGLRLENKSKIIHTSSMWWKPVKTEDGSYIWVSKCSGETLVMATSGKEYKKEGKSLSQERYKNKELKNDEWYMEEIERLNHKVSYYVDGKLFKEIKVGDGDAAPKPIPPNKQGYAFVKWLPEIKQVNSDISLHAEYKKDLYKVRFVYEDNNELIKELEVGYGDSVKTPKVPDKRGGKMFKGWDSDEYMNVTSDITVKAVYYKQQEIPSDGSMIKAIQTMGKWYVNNIYSYQCSLRLDKASNEARQGRETYINEHGGKERFIRSPMGRGRYHCELLEGYRHTLVGDDCTGFALATIYLCTGGEFDTDLDDFYSAIMLEKKFKEKMKNCGFVALESKNMEVSDLQPGDLFVGNGHVEFYLGKSQRFGWGSVKNTYPTSDSMIIKSDDGLYFCDSGHKNYKFVYRKIE